MSENLNSEQHDDDTAMTQAFEDVGIIRDETPQNALKRLHRIADECWKESEYRLEPRPTGGGPSHGHDPVQMMQLFEERVRGDVGLIMALLGPYWLRVIRSFLGRDPRNNRGGQVKPWRHSAAFGRIMRKQETKADKEKRYRNHLSYDLPKGTAHAESCRLHKSRKSDGIKVVQAEVDIKTGKIITLIDKEFGPFAHIVIDGLRLPEVTTGQALAYCDHKTKDVKFIRALCHLIPDPRKPIGEQLTVDIICEAKAAAKRERAA